jgi:gas vesicle protein
MEERPKPRIRGMLLVWLIGLTLGVVAGAATAMLLMPGTDVDKGAATIADRFRNS